MKFLILILLFTSCTFNNSQVINVKEVDVSNSKIESPTHGKVVFDKKQDQPCSWYIITDENQKYLPVNWDKEIKVNQKKIIFNFQLSRAPQPNCFNGKMIILALVK